jgi:hypothetical protein
MMPKNPESEQAFGKRVWRTHCREARLALDTYQFYDGSLGETEKDLNSEN